MVTFSWNGVKRRASKISWAIRGEVGGMVDEGETIGPVSFITLIVRAFFGAY
jgi:hypothetical protein